jgi:hypothetical protein
MDNNETELSDKQMYQDFVVEQKGYVNKEKLQKMRVVYEKLCQLRKFENNLSSIFLDKEYLDEEYLTALNETNDYVEELTLFFTNLK